MMKRPRWAWLCGVLASAALGVALAMAADFEVTGPDGRRILIKDDGTWRYVEAEGKGKEPPGDEAAREKEKPKVVGEAVLSLERKTDGGGGCIFGVRLVNAFPYPIQSFVPTFSAVRSNDVVYDSVSTVFQAVKPGDARSREILFRGIPCHDVAVLRVSGGERCVMGDLDRFSIDDKECLRRIRIAPSGLVRFDK